MKTVQCGRVWFLELASVHVDQHQAMPEGERGDTAMIDSFYIRRKNRNFLEKISRNFKRFFSKIP